MHPSDVQARLVPLIEKLIRGGADTTPIRIEVGTCLFELGFHSLLIVQLVNDIEREFGIRLDFRTFLEHPNADELSAAIAAQLVIDNERQSV